MKQSVLGLDIGGANLKAATADGVARSRPFSLWKQPGQLAKELAHLVTSMPDCTRLAVTMTAELCDCFASKDEGVQRILDAVAALGKPAAVWTSEGRLISLDEARRESSKVAAANWLALATFAGRFAPNGPALLIDIGSTTTDVIPLMDGVPVPSGRTDLERLIANELVYMGVRRTPIFALLPTVRWRERTLRPAAELFATALDAYLVLGDLSENPDDFDTADGRPATRAFAHARLARILCADQESLSTEDLLSIARQVRDVQVRLLREAVAQVGERLPATPRRFILAGVGEFLARQALRDVAAQKVSLQERVGAEASRAACAFALAVLAAERG